MVNKDLNNHLNNSQWFAKLSNIDKYNNYYHMLVMKTKLTRHFIVIFSQ